MSLSHIVSFSYKATFGFYFCLLLLYCNVCVFSVHYTVLCYAFVVDESWNWKDRAVDNWTALASHLTGDDVSDIS